MIPVVISVLKSGGDFTASHANWLGRQVRALGHDYICFTDMDGVKDGIPLERNWPKWWSKMEIYGRNFGPALIVDLDTVFLKAFPIRAEHLDTPIFMRDPWKNGFRHPERLGGGFHYLPQKDMQYIWDTWNGHEEEIMARYGGDDQPFLTELFKDWALRFQDHYIDELVSYKVHVKSLGLQDENRVVYFHGNPRPWHLDEPWIPKLED